MGKEGQAAGTAELELELIKAVRRHREAEAKLEVVHRWQNALPEAVREYEGPARKLVARSRWIHRETHSSPGVRDQSISQPPAVRFKQRPNSVGSKAL